MRRIKYFAVIAFAMTIFISCGDENVLEEGEVVGREYDDYDSWWGSMCVAYKDGLCTVSIPVEKHDDAHWYITIVGYDKDGKQREETHEVTQTLHDMVQNGIYVRLSDQSVVPR